MGGPTSAGGARRVLGKSVAFGQHVGAVPLDHPHRGKRRGQEPLPRYRRPFWRAPRRNPLPVRRAARHVFDNQRAALHPQWVCMEKTWTEVAPSSGRVIEYAGRMLVVLDKIIAAGGCVVPDEFLRAGRRTVRADGKKALGGRFRKHKRPKPGGPAPQPRVIGCPRLACGRRTRPEPHFFKFHE
jgi:hypothetical protein